MWPEYWYRISFENIASFDMSEFQFQIMSDLHLETPKVRPSYESFNIQPQCQCLALMGDIGHASDSRLFDFFNRQLQQFQAVLYLLGNHEPYGMTFPEAKEIVRAFEADVEQRRRSPSNATMGKFVFLDRSRYNLSESLTVFGCTLFSSISLQQRDPVARFVSDFSSIDDWTVDSHNAAHQTDLQWLNSQVLECAQHEPHRSIVVFTHHSPTTLDEADDPNHVKDDAQIRSAFTTDLSSQPCWTTPQVKLWAFGHTHFNCDLDDLQTKKRVVANQKGYRKSELLTFSGSKVVEVDTSPYLGQKVSRVGLDVRKSKNKRKQCVIS
ncbi:MAG: hypothetical protein ASARMPREDX12_005692 [Alectoria sarmentosa]|nr:MAG: hypothetical protein ASARMPREDX12_005692 [Alectoria sarmentosa]